MGIRARLEAYEAKHGAAAIAVIGAGYVAGGVLHTLHQTPGMSPKVVINRNTDRAVEALTQIGIKQHDIVVSNDVDELLQAQSADKILVSNDYTVLRTLGIDIVVEATGAIDYGARVILSSLQNKIHVVSYNAEVDSLLAWRFHQEAAKHNVVYSIADGDQPGALFRLSDQVEAMGFEVTVLLNCKRHLNVHQNPSTGAGYAARDATSALMTTAFGDGTKMQVEQAVVANATGFVPAKRGMYGVESSIATLITDTVDLWSNCVSNDEAEKAASDSGSAPSKSGTGYVDFTLGGDFGAGVGVIAHHPHGEHHAKALGFYKMGDGPNYFFYRPYHLVHLEIPLTIADILLHNDPLASVDKPHVATVVAIAKKALNEGEKLDGIGGFCAYGQVDSYANGKSYLPIALVEFATMKVSLEQDQAIPLDAVTLDEDCFVVQEWRALRELWDA